MPSPYTVNFSIRPNKAVERKLIFETLSRLDPQYHFSSYRYIGFGAVWFIDFLLAHKYLSISDMISIEGDELLAQRAEFNMPYACITVETGDSEVVLPTLPLEEKRLLAWLDYDSSLNGSVLVDLSTLCQRVPSGSVLIVSINSDKRNLPDSDENGAKLITDEERLRFVVGDLIPPRLPPNATQGNRYHAFLADLLFAHVDHNLLAYGRRLNAFRLFNIRYRDGARMVTVGLSIVDDALDLATRRIVDREPLPLRWGPGQQTEIDVPPLTFKEKFALDRLFPRQRPPSREEVQGLGFELKQGQIESYSAYYLHYPTFGEVVL